jgi:basic membrane protein A and related proteins
MKIVIIIVAILALVTNVLCQNEPITSPKLVFVTNVGGVVEDVSFNEPIWNSAKATVESLGGSAFFYESATFEDQETNLRTGIETDNADIGLSAGFLMADAVKAVAKSNLDKVFGLLDFTYDPPIENTVTATFREDQAGYLAGVLAGSLTKRAACIGAFPIPAILKFCGGFRSGFIAAANSPEATVRVEFIPDFLAPELGADAARRFIDLGAGVIFAAAGPTGSGGILEAASLGTYVIGVDADEYFSTFQSGAAAGSEFLLTSAVKRLDVATEVLVSEFASGEWRSGNKVFDVRADGVRLAPCHDSCEAAWTDEVVTAVSAAEQGLRQLIIDTGVDAASGELSWIGATLDGLFTKLTPWVSPSLGAVPTARSGHVAGVLDDGFFVAFGGVDVFGVPLSSTAMTNISAGTSFEWTALADNAAAPSARFDFAGGVWHPTSGGAAQLAVFGGAESASVAFADVWIFDPASGWRQLPTSGSAPSARSGHAASIVGDTLYVFGGRSTSFDVLGDFYALNLDGGQWSRIDGANGPAPRTDAASAGLLERGFFMYGGLESTGVAYTDEFWLFSSDAAEWRLISAGDAGSTSAAHPPPLGKASLVATDRDGLLLYGGQEALTLSSTLWHYGLFADAWSVVRPATEVTPGAIIGASAAIFADWRAPSVPDPRSGQRLRNRLVLFGGASRRGPNNDLWVYGIEPVEQQEQRYFVCSDKQFYVDYTGTVETDFDDVWLDDYACDEYIDCDNLFDEGADCSPSAEATLIAFGVVGALSCIYILAMAVVTIVYRETIVIRGASIHFLMLFLFGALWLQCTIFLFLVMPTDATCGIIAWFLPISFTIMYGSLFAKEWRIAQLTAKQQQLQRLVITNGMLFGIVAALLFVDVVILAVWMGVDAPSAELRQEDDDDNADKYHVECHSEHGTIFFWVLVGYNLLLLAIGAVQAWRTRNANSVLGESTFLALSVYSLLFMSVFVLPLLFLVNDKPTSLFIIVCTAITLAVFITVSLIFAPKCYTLFVKNVRTTSFSMATTGNTTSARGQSSVLQHANLTDSR